MDYPKTKVYFDGSHYIGIPHTEQPYKKRKNKPKQKNETQEKVKELYKSETGTKKEKNEKVVEEIDKEIKDKEKSAEIVNNVLEKEKRNKTVRLTRLLRKARLQEWTHFCTFTYDSSKLTEEEFRKKLLNCLRHLAHRKNWKYIGVFERSPVEKRLHFHGIFVIPQMLGEIVETKDYSTKNHQMQVAHQSTYFLERFGRNDFRPIDKNGIDDSIKYLTKYIGKENEFSRNKYESVIHKKTLKNNGVRIVSCMENIPDTPEGTLMETLLEGFNQYFSEELTQKVNRGLKESWLKGNATGGAHVFGYDIVNKKYVVNEYEKDIVLKCFDMYSNGYRARVIAENLNELGYHRINGKGFDEKYVLFILHNSRYTGIVEHQGVVYDKIFPRIIDDVLWNKVNAINEENKLAPSRKKEIFDYILSGKLICGKCNHKMFGESGTSHTKDIHYYYSCASKRKKRCNCDKKSIQKQVLEDMVINAISKLLGSEKNISMIADKIYTCHQNQIKDNANLKLLEKKRKDTYKSSQNLLKAIEQGIITDMTKTRLQQLETELAELDIVINKEKLKDYSLLSREEIEQFLRKQVFEDTSNIKIRKLIINTFVRQIYLYDDKITILFNFTTPSDKPKLTLEENLQTLEQINSALSNSQSSCIEPQSAPNQE